jgi:alkylhydroperoxidase family enzyme
MGQSADRLVATSSDEAFALTQQAGREIAGRRPEVAAALDNVRAILRDTGTLSPRLVELVRLRVAFHNQCRSCMAVRYQPQLVDEQLVCSLERPEEDENLLESERAAIDYADRFACDHLSIDEDVYARLRTHFDEGEIVELGTRVAMMVGFGRLAATWKLTDHLPESFRAATGEQVTPWRHDEVLADPRVT